jgi:uncharacterized protein YbjT (DUF2867 family)
MNAIVFGATGMVGQGVLRECLRDPEITRVVTVSRALPAMTHAKLRSLSVPDLFDLTPIVGELTNLDACFYCIGVTSLGMSETDYTRITHDLTLAIAKQLLAQNPALSLVFVSGRSADSTERGAVMWARVKGKTENDLFRLPFKSLTVVRPGLIVPRHGIKSRTEWYNALHTVLRPLLPLFERVAPGYVTTTESLGRAMIRFAKGGFDRQVVQGRDLARAGA